MSENAAAMDDLFLADLVQQACPPVTMTYARRQGLQRQLRLEVLHFAAQHEARGPGRLLPTLLWRGLDLGLATAVIMLFAALALVVRFEFLTPQPPQMAAVPATVEVLSGAVTVRSGSEAPRTLQKGERTLLWAGDVVESALAGQALVTYFTGQTTEVGPATHFELLNVSTNGKNDTVVMAKVLQGSTTNAVQAPLPAGSRFELQSPSLTAAVQGTEFRLTVLDAARTFVATDKGQVRVTDSGRSAVVHAGEQVLASSGAELAIVPQPQSRGVWIVQSNDTLWRIAAQYGLTAQDLVDANPWIWDPDLILPGWKLVIPRK